MIVVYQDEGARMPSLQMGLQHTAAISCASLVMACQHLRVFGDVLSTALNF